MSSYFSENEYSPDPEPLHESFVPKNVVHLHHVRHPPDMPEDKEEEQALQEGEIAQPGTTDCLCKAPATKTAVEAGTGSIQSVKGAVEANTPRHNPQPARFQDGLGFSSLPVAGPSIHVPQIPTNTSYQGLEATTSTSSKRLRLPETLCEGSNLDHYDDWSAVQPNVPCEEHQDKEGRDDYDYYATRDFD
jgi:hypothetical protein